MKVCVICEKEMLVKNAEDGIDVLGEEDLAAVEKSGLLKSENVYDFFEEKQFDLKVYGIRSFENYFGDRPEKEGDRPADLETSENKGDRPSQTPAYFKITLREFFSINGEKKSFAPFRSKGLLEWRKDSRFCGSCGGKMKEHHSLTARVCEKCGKIVFPRISPCIIVVIKKEGKILLAEHTYRNQGVYACIAGFIESGESGEEAVRREVLEETGLKIKNLKYRLSQSWPFPDQLMLGYTADWESGELKIQKEEIADAKWFSEDELKNNGIKPGSIAYELIHKWSKIQ